MAAHQILGPPQGGVIKRAAQLYVDGLVKTAVGVVAIEGGQPHLALGFGSGNGGFSSPKERG